MTGSFCHNCEMRVGTVIEAEVDEAIRCVLECGCHETETVGVQPWNALGEMDIPAKWELDSPFESLYDSPTP